MAGVGLPQTAITRQELNKKAKSILAKAQELPASLLAHSHGPHTEDTVTELYRDCQAIKNDIKQLKQQCSQLPRPPNKSQKEDDDSSVVSIENLSVDEVRLKAELAVLQRDRANVLSTDDLVKQAMTYQQLCENSVKLNQPLSVIKNDLKTVQEEKQKEQKLLKETKELKEALKKKLSLAQGETDGDNHTRNVEDELNEKIKMADRSIKKLRDDMVQFISEEIIQPSEDMEVMGRGGERTRKRGRGQVRLDTMLPRRQQDGVEESQYLSLTDVIQRLISQSFNSPHSPYIPFSSIWPPHGNLLMRSGIIQRHPDNLSLVRITPFHL